MPFCSNVRDFERPGRSEAFATGVMAATSHPLATLTALEVLRRGGNAMDAAVAAMALLCVIEAPQTGIGGDCFVLYMPRGEGEIVALNGSGWAPAAASLERYRARGMTAIPSESADAVTVPGAVASWARLVADHGTMKLADLLQPAIAAAEDGYPVSERVARDWAKQVEKLRAQCGGRRHLPAERRGAAARATSIASRRSPPRCAASPTTARRPSIEGWIARDMVDALRAAGGCHTLEDFSAYAPEYVTPIRASYRGYDIWECPPNGQGVVPLAMLRALEGFDPARWPPMSVERCHVLTEIGRQAYADRDCFVGDPRTGRIAGRGAAVGRALRAAARTGVDDSGGWRALRRFPSPITAIPHFSPSSIPSATPWPSSTRSSMISGPASSARHPAWSSTTAPPASCSSPAIPMRSPDASGRSTPSSPRW